MFVNAGECLRVSCKGGVYEYLVSKGEAGMKEVDRECFLSNLKDMKIVYQKTWCKELKEEYESIANFLGVEVKNKGEIKMSKEYEKLRKEFRDNGFVLSKNDFSRGYSSSEDIGDGWTDSNAAIMNFADLKSAKSWLEEMIKPSNMTEK